MKKAALRCILFLALIISIVVISNLSFWGALPRGQVKLLSHRGVHQTFDLKGVDNESCTAARIYKSTHDYLENTIEAVRAAFEFGADAVEIDAIKTRDDEFVVFHDWTLECRTNGAGRTADFSLAELQALDIGHGYSFDGGKTFPFRGHGRHMPALAELLNAFSSREFIINVKGNRPEDAEVLAEYINRHRLAAHNRLSLFAGPSFARRWRAIGGGLVVGTKAEAKQCVKGYLMWGWTGAVPKICSVTGLAVPQNLSWLYWGWPNLTFERMSKNGVDIFLVGPAAKHVQAIDNLSQLDAVPEKFTGWIITNRIEIVGPALKRDTAE